MVAAAKRKKEIILLLAIIFLASFLRFYRLPEYLTFLGDEGRDALAVKRMIVDHKFRLIGPVTSIGNMYLGPLYYYLILPAMLLSGLSPVGPAVLVAFLGVATVGLVWWLGKEWFGSLAGLAAAFLYAVSPVVIIYSRSSWNPNVMPFFSLLTIYGVYQFWQKDRFFWLPIIGLSFSFAVQSHYLGLLLAPLVGLFWFLTLKTLFQDKKKLKPFLNLTVFGFLIFIFLTIIPLVWFDLRHDFINFKAFKAFFTVRQATINLKIYKGALRIWPLVSQVFTRLPAAKNEFWGQPTAIGILGLVIVFFVLEWRKRGIKKINPVFWLLFAWLGLGLIGLANYKQHIYDHYFGFIFPVPFLLVGLISAKLWAKGGVQKLALVVLVGFLTWLAFKESPLRYPPNNQLKRTKEIAAFVLEKAAEKPFNLALIAKTNYHDAYAYFMEIWGRPPTSIEPLRVEETITDQLFVICEALPCQPINHPLAEIANFGWAEIDQKWEIAGVEIYRLQHSYPE